MSLNKKHRAVSLEKAQTRLAALQVVADIENLSSDVSLADYQNAIETVRGKLIAYNSLLAQSDEAKEVLQQAERELNDYSDRILAAVGVKYGKASDAYVTAGGTRKYENRRSYKQISTQVDVAGDSTQTASAA